MKKIFKLVIPICIGLTAGILFWILWGHNLSVSIYSKVDNSDWSLYETDEVSLEIKLGATILVGIISFLLSWLSLRFYTRKRDK